MKTLLKQEQPWVLNPAKNRPKPILVSTDVMMAGTQRAAHMINLLLPFVTKAGWGLLWLGRSLLRPTCIIVEKGPYERDVELQEEYPIVREAQLKNTYLRW